MLLASWTCCSQIRTCFLFFYIYIADKVLAKSINILRNTPITHTISSKGFSSSLLVIGWNKVVAQVISQCSLSYSSVFIALQIIKCTGQGKPT